MDLKIENLYELEKNEKNKLLNSVKLQLNIDEPQTYYPIYQLLKSEDEDVELKNCIFNSKYKCTEILGLIEEYTDDEEDEDNEEDEENEENEDNEDNEEDEEDEGDEEDEDNEEDEEDEENEENEENKDNEENEEDDKILKRAHL